MAEFQGMSSTEVILDGSSQQAVPGIKGDMLRTQLIVQNNSTDSNASITIFKGTNPISADGQGITLLPNFSFVEATDSGFVCYQGPIQVKCADSTTGVAQITEGFVSRKSEDRVYGWN